MSSYGVTRSARAMTHVQLHRRHTGVNTRSDLLGDFDRLDKVAVETVRELVDACGDLVERDAFTTAVASGREETSGRRDNQREVEMSRKRDSTHLKTNMVREGEDGRSRNEMDRSGSSRRFGSGSRTGLGGDREIHLGSSISASRAVRKGKRLDGKVPSKGMIHRQGPVCLMMMILADSTSQMLL